MLVRLVISAAVLALVYSCGKQEKGSSKEEPYTPPVLPEREEILGKQEILCEPGTFCPDYIAKIVVFDKGSVRYCTGTLIDRNKLLTSASCLPSYLRSTEADCSQDIHFFFNKGSRPPERLKCKSILQVSELDGNNTEYWRDDVAILEMSDKLIWREHRDISKKGMRDGDKVRFFAIEQSNNFTAVIRKEECEVVHNSYLYPLSANESSPNTLLAGCSRKQGYRGAAILDGFPRIRAVLSDNSGLKVSLENSPLLIKPLKDFVHVSNFACAPFLNETGFLEEQECAKPLNYPSIAGLRSGLLSDEERFSGLVQKLEQTANSFTKYHRLSAVLTSIGDKHVLDWRPSCFKNVSSWINSVKGDGDVTEAPELPKSTLRKGVDSYGRAVTQEVEDAREKYYFTFSGKRLFKEKLSDVFVSTQNTDTRRLSGLRSCQ